MHHLAIMNKSWHLIPKILNKEKVIESRWYQTKRTPWDKVKVGDTIFFKNAGELVSAKARISRVFQFTIHHISDATRIVETYGKKICLIHVDPNEWGRLPKYCILMFLEKPMQIKKPFQINKKGFGTGAAWITVKNIKTLQM